MKITHEFLLRIGAQPDCLYMKRFDKLFPSGMVVTEKNIDLAHHRIGWWALSNFLDMALSSKQARAWMNEWVGRPKRDYAAIDKKHILLWAKARDKRRKNSKRQRK